MTADPRSVPVDNKIDLVRDKQCSICKDGWIYTEVDLAVALGDFGLIERGGPG